MTPKQLWAEAMVAAAGRFGHRRRLGPHVQATDAAWCQPDDATISDIAEELSGRRDEGEDLDSGENWRVEWRRSLLLETERVVLASWWQIEAVADAVMATPPQTREVLMMTAEGQLARSVPTHMLDGPSIERLVFEP